MAEEVQWAFVSGCEIAFLSRSVSGKRKAEDFHEYDDVLWEDFPAVLRHAAPMHGWEHFGRIDSVYVAGPNKQARLKAARVVVEAYPSVHVRQPSKEPVATSAGGLRAWAENGQLCIEAVEYCKGGVDPHKLLLDVQAQICQLNLVGPFQIRVFLQGFWWSPSVHSLQRRSSECGDKVLQGPRQVRGFNGFCGDMTLSENDLDDLSLLKVCFRFSHILSLKCSYTPLSRPFTQQRNNKNR